MRPARSRIQGANSDMTLEMDDPISKLSSLNRFSADPDLARLEDMLAEFDVFAFLGVSTKEEIHSKILAWLLNPQENHSAGDYFLMNFLVETKAVSDKVVRAIDWSETSVQQEWRNMVDGETGFLDILILNTGASFACAIENKIFSGEHGEQLTRYRQALEQQYGSFHRSHLFLTPRGTSPERPEERHFWTPVDYDTILRLVQRTLEEDGVNLANEEVKAFLQQYATALRRRIVPDTNLAKLATKIYLRHKEAIELIHRYKDSYYLDDVREICKEAIERQEGWHLVGERDRGELLGFIDTSWQNFSVFHTGTAWLPDTDALLMLDFDFREVGQVSLLLTISSADSEDSEDVRKLLFDKTQGKHPGIFDHRGSPRGGYRKSTIRLYASKPILSNSDFVDGDVASWRDGVTRWLSDFTESEFPKMNEIILDSLQEIEIELGHQQALMRNTRK